VTITSIDEVSSWPEFVVADVVDELPAVSTNFEGGEVLDLQDHFKVATRPGEIILFWGEFARCTAYRCGGVCFLTVDQVLTGVWFTGLTDEETKLFVSHVGGM
jgi:hypothetical protein